MIVIAVIMCILGSVGVICFLTEVGEKLGLDSGCLSAVLGFFLFGVYIGGIVVLGLWLGKPGVAIFNILGIILGIVGIKLAGGVSGLMSSSSSSIHVAMRLRAVGRNNGVRTCYTCMNYSLTGGVCKIDDNPKPAGGICNNWR